MSEATIAHWKITRAKNAGQKPNPHGGQFDKWYIGLENLDGGSNCDDAYWQRKAPSEAQVGDHVYGKLEEGEYGFRFYLEKDEQGGSPRPSSGSTEYSKPAAKAVVDWDARNAEIRRQHSQEMALRVIVFNGRAGAFDDLQEWLRDWADWFDQDAIAAGRKASGWADAKRQIEEMSERPPDFTGARTEEPKPSLNFHKSELPTVDRDHVMQLLDSSGLVYAGAQEKVADFILTQLVPQNREKKALAGLQDLDRQGVVLAQLKSETEKWLGAPLPQGDALDGQEDVPF